MDIRKEISNLCIDVTNMKLPPELKEKIEDQLIDAGAHYKSSQLTDVIRDKIISLRRAGRLITELVTECSLTQNILGVQIYRTERTEEMLCDRIEELILSLERTSELSSGYEVTQSILEQAERDYNSILDQADNYNLFLLNVTSVKLKLRSIREGIKQEVIAQSEATKNPNPDASTRSRAQLEGGSLSAQARAPEQLEQGG